MTPPTLPQTRPAAAVHQPIGFPGATDFDYTALAPTLARRLLNNVGDPNIDGTSGGHTKDVERQVVDIVATMFRAPPGRWGYVTTGSSEGNLWALREARRRLPAAIVYHSSAAHYCVPKAVDLLAMTPVVVATDPTGEIDYVDLRQQVNRHRDRPAIVVATAGTTMTEAVDDTRQILAILDNLDITRRYVHVDAALAGIPLALLPPAQRPGLDFVDGADSIVVSGHKFLGSPAPCGILIARTTPTSTSTTTPTGRVRPVPYIGAPDTTITGSRSGHTPLILRAALQRHGLAGLRQRAQRSRELADHALARLAQIGWPAWKHPHAFTVVLDRQVPAGVGQRWSIPTAGGRSHIICMPGLTTQVIDAFITDLRTATRARHRTHIPRQPNRNTAGEP